MRVVRTISELRETHASAGRVGLVPTMGAFHEGHLTLMREARSDTEFVVVSLFVNPTQFAPSEDLAKYPRQEALDVQLAESEEVDVVFAPTVEEMYPSGATTVHVSEVGDSYEGAHRPGHFDGVATVVLKLFNIVKPDVAYFGLKDLQQCAVISRMVSDLNVDVKLRFIETVREATGLALSSRNAYLSGKDRDGASWLFAVLFLSADILRNGGELAWTLDGAIDQLRAQGFEVDYFDLVDPKTMQSLKSIQEDARLVAAVRYGSIRLIDNVPVSPQLR